MNFIHNEKTLTGGVKTEESIISNSVDTHVAATRVPFPSLDNKKLGLQLEDYINKLKKESEKQSLLSEQSSVLKTRRNAKENFTYSLLLGVAEAYEKGKTIEGLDLISTDY